MCYYFHHTVLGAGIDWKGKRRWTICTASPLPYSPNYFAIVHRVQSVNLTIYDDHSCCLECRLNCRRGKRQPTVMSPGNSVLCCYADLSGQMTPSAIPGGSMPSPLVEKGQLIDSIWAHLRSQEKIPAKIPPAQTRWNPIANPSCLIFLLMLISLMYKLKDKSTKGRRTCIYIFIRTKKHACFHSIYFLYNISLYHERELLLDTSLSLPWITA